MNTPVRKPRLWIRVPLIVLATAVVATFAVAAWLVGTTAGASLVLAAAGLQAEGLDGRIAGRLQARSIRYVRPNLRVVVEQPDFDWSPRGLLAGRFQVTYLKAESIEVAVAPSKERAGLPITVEPPLVIRIGEASIKELRLGTLTAGDRWTPDIALSEISSGPVSSGARWTFERLRARTQAGHVEVSGTVGSHAPFPIDATAQLIGVREGNVYRLSARTRGELAKLEAVIRGEEGGITGEATAAIEPFHAQPLRRLRGKLEGIDISTFAPAAPRTRLTVDADFTTASDGAFSGTAGIVNADPGPLDRDRIPVTEARARLRIQGARYEFTQAVITLAGGGTASGIVTIEGQRAEIDLEVRELDLARWHGKLRATKLGGTVAARATAGSQQFEVKLSEPRFEIAGRASVDGGRLKVEEARIARGNSVARVQGSMDLGGARSFELTALLEHVDPAAFADAPAGDINGKVQARGALTPSPAGEIAIELAAGRFAGLPLGGHVRIAGGEKRISRADVSVSLGEARLQVAGALGGAGDALDVKLGADDVTPIARAFGVDLSGSIEAEARFAGAIGDPSVRVKVEGEELRLPGGLRAPSAKVAVDGTQSRHRATLDASLAQEQRLQVAWQGGVDFAGAKPAWRGRIESASLAGPNPLTLAAPATLTVARDLVEVGEAVLKSEVGDARFILTRWTPARIEAKGVSDGLLTRPILRALGVTPQARSNLVLAAEWDVRAAETLDGFIRVRRVRGDVRLGEPTVALGLEEFGASVEAARGQVKAALAIRGTRIGRIDAQVSTEIRKDGEAWKLPREAPLSGEIALGVPTIAWAAAWLGPDARIEGRVAGQVAIAGTLGAPAWKGSVAAEGLKLRESNLGFEIDEGRAVFALNEREVVIEAFELASAWRERRRAERLLADVVQPDKGTISASGRIDFATRTGTITVRSQAYPFTQLSNRFVAASGEVRVQAGETGVNVTGNLKADAGFFGIAETAPPSLSDDVLVDRGTGIPEGPRERLRIGLDLRFNLGEHLHFTGRGLRTRLAGEVRLRGEPGRSLQSTGQIRTVGGTYDAYGQRLAIERGVLNFQGAIENPGLNVLAVREGLPVVAGVEILGNVAHPAVRLYSRPDVPDHEKLSWLVLGRGPTEAAEGDAATLVAAANALLGANRENRRILRQFGVDEMRVGRGDSASALGAFPQSTIAGRTGSGSGVEVIVLGKRLSKDLYVSYQQSLADAEATLRFSYQVTERLQLLLRASNKPGLDAVYRWK